MDKKSYEEIKYDGKLIAIIVRSNYTSDKVVFFSPPDFSQLAYGSLMEVTCQLEIAEALGFIRAEKYKIVH